MHDGPVLICYDGSRGSRRAITAAAELLVKRRAVVLDVGDMLTVAESYAALGPVMPNFEEANAEEARDRANVGAGRARGAGFDAEARSELAAPTWEGVVEVAAELDAAVIVVGSRGLSGVRELAEGSVSHQIAAHAGRPVLIVPPPRSSS
jgi:nucleotide-binding universal stress UspA family protein